jgi:GTP-binding nuclear protein Ran
MSTQPKIPTFKIVLVGCGGVGKTSFVTRHGNGGFEKSYFASYGVEIGNVSFYTNRGPILFIFYTISATFMSNAGIGQVIEGADAAIIMFDLTSKVSYKNIPNHFRTITRICDNIPIYLCGNKCEDMVGRKLKDTDIRFPEKKGIPYCEISVKTCLNIEIPLLEIAKILVKDSDLSFSLNSKEGASSFDLNETQIIQDQDKTKE